MASQTNTAVSETRQVIEINQDTAHILTDDSKSSEIPPSHSNFVLKDEGGLEQVAKALTEREYPLENFSMKSTHGSGTILKTYQFPGEFFKYKGTANLAYLRNWTYWNSDLTFSLQVTAPKTVYGTLGVAYAYGISDMNTIEVDQRKHVGALCQQYTQFVDLSNNNKITIEIPYKSFKTYGTVDDNVDRHSLHNMVQVTIFVLVPVRSTISQVYTVDIQTFISLKNLRLSGIRFKPEMFSSLAVKAAEKMLNYYFPDANRDMPTDVSHPNQVVVRNSQAMCYGNGVPSVTQPLRLFNGATTPFSFDNSDEMGINFIASRPGLIDIFRLSIDQVYSVPVTPMAAVGSTLVVKTSKLLDLYYQPPVSVVSSLAARWRGSLKYTFIIPHNQFITGKLICAYVPGHRSPLNQGKELLMPYLKNAYHTIFEFGSSNEFSYEVPYISDTPFRCCSSYNDENNSGTLYLTAYSNIATGGMTSFPDIRVAVFLSAGSTFEIMVPQIPKFGLGYDRSIGTKSDILLPTPDHGDAGVYFGTWNYFQNSKAFILRYGNTTAHVAQFAGDTKNYLWKAEKPVTVVVVQDGVEITLKDLTWFCCPVGIDATYNYLAPFESEAKAKAFANNPDNSHFIATTPGSENAEYLKFSDWRVINSGVKVANRADGESGPVVALSSKLERLSYRQFGESMLNLKDLLRRFNPFGEAEVDIKTNVTPGFVLFSIPVQMLAPAAQHDENASTARRFLREGAISLIGSGFRFARGSLRYKLIFSTPSNCGITVGVYHAPDAHGLHGITSPVAFDENSFMESGYAGVLQDVELNSVIDIEVPYYKPTEYQSVGHFSERNVARDFKESITNGAIRVVVHSKPQTDFKLTMKVLYAFGDDCRYSVFNGFGPVVNRADIPRTKLKVKFFSRQDAIDLTTVSEQSTDSEESQPSRPRKSTRSGVVYADPHSGVVNPEAGLLDWFIPNRVNQTLDNIDATLSSVSSTSQNFDQMLESVKSMILSAGGNVDIYDRIVKLLVSCSHLMYSHSVGTVATVFVQFMLECKLLTVKVAVQAIEVCTRLYNACSKYFAPELPQQNASGEEVATAEFNLLSEDEITSCCSLLLVLIGGALGITITKDPKGLFTNSVVRDIKEYAQTSNSLVSCFRMNYNLLNRMIQHIKYQFLPDEGRELAGLVEDGVNIRDWYDKCMRMLNPSFKNEIKINRAHCMEVFLLKAYGEQIYGNIITGQVSGSKVGMVIKQTLDKITTLQEELAMECLAPQIRFEPFVLQVSGDTNIGKSFLIDRLVVEICKIAGIKTTKPKFVITPGNKYWNGCDVQPVCVMDDFLQLQEDQAVADAVSNLFHLKSTQPFNPPIAEIENKKIYYNPIACILTSNASFYDGSNTLCLCASALHRRRNFLIEAKLKPEYAGSDGGLDPSKLTPEISKNYGHLEFRKCTKVGVETFNEATWTEYMAYSEMLRMLQDDLSVYMTSKRRDYIARCEIFKEILPTVTPSTDMDEYRNIFIDRLRSNSLSIPSEEVNDIFERYARLHSRHTTPVVADAHSGIDNALVEEFITAARDSEMARTAIERFKSTGSGNLVDSVSKYEFLNVCKSIAENVSVVREIAQEERCDVHRCIVDFPASRFKFIRSTNKYSYTDDELDTHTVSISPCYDNCCLRDTNIMDVFLRDRIVAACDILRRGESIADIEPEIIRFIGYLCVKASFEWPDVIQRSSITYLPPPPSRSDKLRQFLVASKNQVTQYLELIADSVYGFLRKYGKAICIGVTTVIGAYMMVKHRRGHVSVSFSSESTIYDGGANQTASRGSTAARKSIARQARRSIKQRGLFANAQSGTQSEDLIRLIGRNSVRLTIRDARGNITQYCNATGIADRLLITAGHFVEALLKKFREDSSFILYVEINGSDPVSVRFDQLVYFYDDITSALAFIRLPVRFPCFRDIRRHIATLHELELLAAQECQIVDHMAERMVLHDVQVSECEGVEIRETEFSNSFYCQSVFKYNKGRSGMCGSCLISNQPSPRIIGIHIAGNGSNIGYAEPIAAEGFSQLEDMADYRKIEDHPEANTESYEQKLNLVGSFIVEETIKDGVRSSSQTTYKRTEMYGEVEPTEYRPARLGAYNIYKNEDGTSHKLTPMEAGVSKHGYPPIPFPPSMLEKAKVNLQELIIAVCPNPLIGDRVKSELTDAQIFEGEPGIPELKGIELHTSEGMPLQKYRKKTDHNKTWCFEFDVDNEVRKLKGFHPRFQDEIDKNMALRKEGIIPPTTFTTSLKDCLVSKKKFYAEGGTRTFSVSPLEFTWQIKKYFGWFQVAYMRSRIKSETTVGINPDSLEWVQLLHYLNEVRCAGEDGNEQFITGDYKAFGDTLQPECVKAAFEIMIEWYKVNFNIDEEGVRIRRLLCDELLNSFTLASNVLFKKFCGLHSGFALTVEINSLVNCLYYRCAWLGCGLQLQYFSTNVRLNTYGDDSIGKVSDKFIGKFNFCTIRDFLGKYGILFTSASKDADENRPSITLTEVTYLKRSFISHPTRPYAVLAALPKDSIANPLNYYRQNKTKTADTCLYENCRAALNNAFGQGPEYYMDLRQRILNWVSERKHELVHLPTWEEMDENIFSN